MSYSKNFKSGLTMHKNNERLASQTVLYATQSLEYEFYNHPRYEPRESYEEALKIFLERIKDVPGVVSVYESGTGVSRPGISDIDLIVVVEDDADSEIIREGISEAKTDEYFFFHGPEVLTREGFEEYYNVLPMPKELYLHHGEELEYEQNREPFNYLCYLVDSVNTTYPMEFLDFLFFPGLSVSHHQLNIVVNDLFDLLVPRLLADRTAVTVNSRFAIHRLNSLRNDMMLFVESSGRDAPRLEDFDQSITDLRECWFELSRSDQEALLLKRLQDAITACFVFVGHISEHLQEIGVEVDASAIELRPQDIYQNEYRNEWHVDVAERKTCEFYREDRVKTCVLPATVSVNDRLRESSSSIRAPDEYVNALNTRDSTRNRRMASMEAYKYHPLRSQYKSVMRTLFKLKTRIAR